MKQLFAVASVAAVALLVDAFAGAQGAGAQSAGSSPVGNVAAGKAAFMKAGCYECHGSLGQGNLSAGPAIAPHPIPFDGFLGYIRAPRGEMPPFDEHELPLDEAQNIWAYLQSIPSGPAPGTIAALRAIDTGNAGTAAPVAPEIARGHEIFSTYCVKCHVSARIGPPLANVKAHETLAVTIAQIKNPAPPMPKLFPATLSEQDVNDVAAYVQTL